MTSPIKLKIDGFQGAQSPLIKFSGKVIKREVLVNPNRFDASKQTTVGKFVMNELTVMESREPYTQPLAEIEIIYSESEDSRWGAFAKSFREQVPAEFRTGDDPLAALDGKVVEWEFRAGKVRGPVRDEDGNAVKGADGRDTWATQQLNCWQINSVEGMGEARKLLVDEVLSFLSEPKSDEEINAQIFTNADWKKLGGYQDAVNATADRTFLPSMAAAGKVTKTPDGKWVKA